MTEHAAVRIQAVYRGFSARKAALASEYRQQVAVCAYVEGLATGGEALKCVVSLAQAGACPVLRLLRQLVVGDTRWCDERVPPPPPADQQLRVVSKGELKRAVAVACAAGLGCETGPDAVLVFRSRSQASRAGAVLRVQGIQTRLVSEEAAKRAVARPPPQPPAPPTSPPPQSPPAPVSPPAQSPPAPVSSPPAPRTAPQEEGEEQEREASAPPQQSPQRDSPPAPPASPPPVPNPAEATTIARARRQIAEMRAAEGRRRGMLRDEEGRVSRAMFEREFETRAARAERAAAVASAVGDYGTAALSENGREEELDRRQVRVAEESQRAAVAKDHLSGRASIAVPRMQRLFRCALARKERVVRERRREQHRDATTGAEERRAAATLIQTHGRMMLARRRVEREAQAERERRDPRFTGVGEQLLRSLEEEVEQTVFGVLPRRGYDQRAVRRILADARSLGEQTLIDWLLSRVGNDGCTCVQRSFVKGWSASLAELLSSGSRALHEQRLHNDYHLGDSLLHLAGVYGRPEAAAVLVDNASSPEMLTAHNGSPLPLTPLLACYAVAPASVAWSCSRSTRDLSALRRRRHDCAEVIFRAVSKAGMPVTNCMGASCAHIALLSQDVDALVHCVSRLGVPISSTDSDGRTPLHYLSAFGSVNCTLDADSALKADSLRNSVHAFAAKFGGNVNAQDSLGNTALHYASREPNAQMLVRALLDVGAVPSVPNAMRIVPESVVLDTQTSLKRCEALGTVQHPLDEAVVETTPGAPLRRPGGRRATRILHALRYREPAPIGSVHRVECAQRSASVPVCRGVRSAPAARRVSATDKLAQLGYAKPQKQPSSYVRRRLSLHQTGLDAADCRPDMGATM
eukprot:TRINITY_DN7657_c0_g1_i1.p1 TRINITY_DN7657_c0_g1~~TRINITY_DN7657_c0_g1_i1.p1  ORF type:complete len:863 (+),score=123.44 TRINITY_DN7657_c0_g1_i1:114-2702(+)